MSTHLHYWWPSTSIALALVLALAAWLLLWYFSPPHLREGFFKLLSIPLPFGQRPRKMPPGPRGYPLVGSLYQMRHARRDVPALTEWLISMATYGPLTTLHMGSKTWVLLNTNKAVADIIATNGSITHERPHLPIASDLVSRGRRTVLRQTAGWIEGRRVMHQMLNNPALLHDYGSWIERESTLLLASYLYRPEKWYSHHYRYANAVIHRIVLGHRLLRSTPELVAFQRVGIQFIRSINASWIDFFPALARLPAFLQPWRAYWAAMGAHHQSVFQSWWHPVKAAIAAGTAPPSFVRDTLLHPDTKFKGTDDEAMYVAMSVIGAGSDNPRLTLNTFVMSALVNRPAHALARAEVDAVCGSVNGKQMRLPTLQDMDTMPYTLALIKEILRWRPVMPVIPPHELTRDLDYAGYRLPVGTNFVINFAACGRSAEWDDGEWGDSETFDPRRWLKDGKVDGGLLGGLWQFGGGRRLCVGYKIAQMELWVAVARMVFCFDYEADGPYDSRRLNHAVLGEPFPVKVTVRSETHAKLIDEEARRAGVLEEAMVEF